MPATKRRRLSPSEVRDLLRLGAEHTTLVDPPADVPVTAPIVTPVAAMAVHSVLPATAPDNTVTEMPPTSEAPGTPPTLPSPRLAATRVHRAADVVDASSDEQGAVTRAELSMSVRREALLAVRCEGACRADVDAVQGIVADRIIELVPYISWESDRSLLTAGVAYAQYARRVSPDGRFLPERDITEPLIDDFLNYAKSDMAETTRATYASQLRRLGAPAPRRSKSPRTKAAAPYNAHEERRLWKAATATDDHLRVEMRTECSLAFGAGAAANEIHLARASQVVVHGARTTMQLADKNGVVREVPVYGHYARWLQLRAEQLDPDAYLLRPGCSSRRNATANLVSKAAELDPAFKDFKITRARHTWVVANLHAGIPFHLLCQAAGVGLNNNLPTDLLPFLPTGTTLDIRTAFDRARSTRPTTEELR